MIIVVKIVVNVVGRPVCVQFFSCSCHSFSNSCIEGEGGGMVANAPAGYWVPEALSGACLPWQLTRHLCGQCAQSQMQMTIAVLYSHLWQLDWIQMGFRLAGTLCSCLGLSAWAVDCWIQALKQAADLPEEAVEIVLQSIQCVARKLRQSLRKQWAHRQSKKVCAFFTPAELLRWGCYTRKLLTTSFFASPQHNLLRRGIDTEYNPRRTNKELLAPCLQTYNPIRCYTCKFADSRL